MTPAVRLSAALLLAVLVQVSLPDVVWAQNTPWKLDSAYGWSRDDTPLHAISRHENGTIIILSCTPGRPKSEFVAGITVDNGDSYPSEEVAVSWRVDEGIPQEEIWETRSRDAVSAAFSQGQRAYDLALAIYNAQNRIIFRDQKGMVVFDANGSAEALGSLLLFCRLIE